jgi:ABC-type dipeptide/oligopeptide/nickel transport system permease component
VIIENGSATLELTFWAMVVALSVGIGLGLLAGRLRDSGADVSIRMFGIVVYAMPAFFLGFLAQLLFGERLGVAGSIGVVALLIGFLWLQRPWRAIALARSGGADARKAAGDSAILFALATGVMIATYTAIDRIGTREIDVFTYAAILWLTCSVVLVAWVALVAGGDLLRYGPEASRRAAVGGILTLAAYLCILVALSVAPLSGVAPLRESATVFAAAWGSVRMGEAGDPREAVRRIGASVLIVGGALLLAVGS